MSLKKIIPNPFDQNTTLSGVAQKAEIIKEGVGFVNIFKKIFVLLILGFILVSHLGVPKEVILLLVGGEILVRLFIGYTKIKEIKAVGSIDTKSGPKSYRQLLITNGYWEFLKSAVSLFGNGLSLLLVLIFFSKDIIDFLGYYSSILPSGMSVQLASLRYFIFAFIIFRVFECLVKFVGYGWVKNIKETDDFAEMDREYLVIEKKLKLLTLVPIVVLILWVFYFFRVPYNVSLVFGGAMVLMIVLSFVSIKRVQNVDFRSKNKNNERVSPQLRHYANEKVVLAIFGIMKTSVRSFSVLGVGKTNCPENSLILTNTRLLMVEVPVSGGSAVVGDRQYTPDNFFFNRGEIRNKGEEILRTNTISKVLEITKNDVAYGDIKHLTLKNTKIVIEKFSGEKLSYFFMDKEYIAPLSKVLREYLQERFVEKT